MSSQATEKVSTAWHGREDSPRSEGLRESSRYADVGTVRWKEVEQVGAEIRMRRESCQGRKAAAVASEWLEHQKNSFQAGF